MANFHKAIIDMFVEFCSTATAREIIDAVKSAEDLKNEFDASHALIAASAKNKPDVISALISAGMNANTRSYDGSTPLMMAALLNSEDVIDVLIKAGADDIPNKNGRTALILAAMLNNPQVVAELINAGSNVNAKDSDGKNALNHARENPKISGTPVMSLLEKMTAL